MPNPRLLLALLACALAALFAPQTASAETQPSVENRVRAFSARSGQVALGEADLTPELHYEKLCDLRRLASGSPLAAKGGGGGIRVTDKGIARVENHLKSLDALDEPANAAMLGRLRAGEATPHDISFYMHELKESAVMRRGFGARDAHLKTLQWQGIPYKAGYESQIYHPSVISEFSEYFNPAAWPK